MNSQLRLFGIRHHGPGTARALLAALASYRPDCVLVEGPPDADDLIHWLAHPALIMPVALLVYRPDEPRRGVFYPFADFSPEYRALRFALERGAAAAFMDLPRRFTLATDVSAAMPPLDAFRSVAAAAGYDSYEAWWNQTVEQADGGEALFPAVLEMVTEMRQAAQESAPPLDDPAGRLAAQREAAMRRRIRQAAAEGHQRIAAVCGAWHAPALVDALTSDEGPDEAMLRDLPAVETAATWLPWTYGRLVQAGGYGAGVASPGWYDHLWQRGASNEFRREDSTVRWLARVAELLRDEGMDTSPGHVIETVRLAEALAAMRGRPFPGLPELEEAALSAMCGGNEEPMRLIRRRLIVGERMGQTPPDVPAVPLQRDLAQQQARLKLRPEPEPGTLKLDLRQEMHLERSRLLHRLALLDVAWGTPAQARGQQAGTFAELWKLQWVPELSVKIIEAAVWGNTVRDAAAARAEDIAAGLTELPDLTQLVDRVVLADLPEAMPSILARIEEQSAVSRDVPHLLATLPPLAHVLRYGGLRQAAEHLPLLRRVFDHLLTRACLGLPGACGSLDEAAAADMIERLTAAGPAVRLVQDADAAGRWHAALGALADRPGIHPAVAGRATRLLQDEAVLRAEGVIARLERALSPAGSTGVARYAADWLDGFLRDSGLLLVHDRAMWAAIDRWIIGLGPERFQSVLPLLRRTFADFPDGVRRQLQDRLREGGDAPPRGAGPAAFDPVRAAAVLPAIGRLLGVSLAEQEAAP
ncbi:MAG: hypothetical protein KA170_00745 [Candidatus Promineofilum sp.]|nr:hypothetical protein [Promineifilum sp.]